LLIGLSSTRLVLKPSPFRRTALAEVSRRT
jgi:hypothetical protein